MNQSTDLKSQALALTEIGGEMIDESRALACAAEAQKDYVDGREKKTYKSIPDLVCYIYDDGWEKAYKSYEALGEVRVEQAADYVDDEPDWPEEICPGCRYCRCAKCGGWIVTDFKYFIEGTDPVFACKDCGEPGPEENEDG